MIVFSAEDLASKIIHKIVELSSTISGAIIHVSKAKEVEMASLEKIRKGIPKDFFLAASGGVFRDQDIAQLDKLGISAISGDALINNGLDLGLAIAAPLSSDRSDGLFPTVVVDEQGAIPSLFSFTLIPFSLLPFPLFPPFSCFWLHG